MLSLIGYMIFSPSFCVHIQVLVVLGFGLSNSLLCLSFCSSILLPIIIGLLHKPVLARSFLLPDFLFNNICQEPRLFVDATTAWLDGA